MQSASFLLPYDSVFKTLQVIAKRKGYVITSADSNEGIIKANSRNFLFKKTEKLEIKVYKKDLHTTNISLMINNNASLFEKPASLDEFEEQRLLDTIHKYF